MRLKGRGASLEVDLSGCEYIKQEISVDICIIGAGASGIYLATQLARKGHLVALIEAGPIKTVDSNSIGFDPYFEKVHYRGATHGRYFGMGGSTSNWGGLLVPHTHFDSNGIQSSKIIWDHIADVVSRTGPTVLAELGYENGWDFESYAQEHLGEHFQTLKSYGFITQAPLCLPFSRKNLFGLLKKSQLFKSPPTVFYNAVAKNWILEAAEDGSARAAKIIAVSRNMNKLVVGAKKYIIASGAIESARILMELNGSGGIPPIPPSAAIGSYLADHLSMPIADVFPDDLACAAAIFAPQFSGSWMRPFRFLYEGLPLNTPRCFAHFIFSNSSYGFKLAKDILNAMQKRQLPNLNLKSTSYGVFELFKFAYKRYAKSALYISPQTPIQLQLDIEQVPVRENRVFLRDNKDEYGRQMVGISWDISGEDILNISNAAAQITSKWPGDDVDLPRLLPKDLIHTNNKPYDAYHPVGTCHMGKDSEAVVDLTLKVRGIENVWVSSTGVLPSAGSANPTFTMLCLAQDLVNNV